MIVVEHVLFAGVINEMMATSTFELQLCDTKLQDFDRVFNFYSSLITYFAYA